MTLILFRTPCSIHAVLLACLISLGGEAVAAAPPNDADAVRPTAQAQITGHSSTVSAAPVAAPKQASGSADDGDKYSRNIENGSGAVLVLAIALLIYSVYRARLNLTRTPRQSRTDTDIVRKGGPGENPSALQLFLEFTTDPVLRYDRDCRRLYANPAATRLLGKISEALIGNTPADEALLTPAQGSHLMETVRGVFASAKSREISVEMLMPTGEYGHYCVLLIPERAPNGEVESVLAMSRDMAETRRIEARQAQFFDVVPGLFYTLIHKPSGDYVMSFANAGVYDLYGLDPEAVMADFSTLLALIHPDDVKRRQDELAASEHDLTPLRIDYRIIHPQKGLRWLEVHSLPQRLPNGGTRWDGFVHDITERKRIESELHHREDEFRTLTENLPVAIIRYDANQQRRYLNPAAERMLRGTTDELLGQVPGGPTVPATPAMLAHYRSKMNEALTTYDAQELEFALDALPFDEQEHYEVRFVAEPGADGKPPGVLAIWYDITERKRAEGRLREALDLNTGVINSIPDILFEVDRDGRYLSVWTQNPDFGDDHRAYLLGKTISQVLSPESTAVAMAAIRTADEQGVAYGYELSITQENGEIHWHDHSVSKKSGRTPVNDSFIVLSRNVTERKRMEEALTKERAVLKTFFGALPDLAWMKDSEGRYLACNPLFEQFFGAAEADILGKTDLDFVDAELATLFRLKDKEAEAAGKPCSNEEWVTFAVGGRRALLETVKSPVVNAEGKIIAIIGVAHDITERKQMEQALAARELEFRSLVENTPDTVARFDCKCRLLFANATYYAQKKNAAASLGKRPAEFLDGEFGIIIEAKINEVFTTGQNTEFELQWKDRNGNSSCSHVRLTAERDASGMIVSVLAVGHDITELSLSRQKIHQMAFYDTLTALPNRALFNDRLQQMLIEAARHGQQAGVMLLDLDRFKVVNDTLGHPAGDQLLREAGARLSSCLRDYDTVARLGGDEFAILLPEIRAGNDMGKIASNLLAQFKAPFILENTEVFVSTSIGIAAYPGDGLDADELIKQADSAMYSAKHSGRNTFRFYSKDLTDSANERLTLETDLRHGFARSELELYYQPKIRLADGFLLGSEALLRWHHPARGMVPPDKFIPIAEDSGQIIEIGAWVLRQACRTASHWNAPGKPRHKVAVNLSARQFQVGNLLQTVRDALNEANCQTDWIELEITESMLLDEDGKVLEVLETFRAMGITIAIDDFGTGYSSLSYLARFPIDTLKIDRSFTSRVTNSEDHAELVKAMISIAHNLKQQVVAEGVETEAEADFLREHGCHIGQGYLYGKPVAKSVFESLSFANGPPETQN